MQFLKSILLLLCILVLCQCSSKNANENNFSENHHSSKNSLDWNAQYVGTLPCADCPGIRTELELHLDQHYLLKQEYLEKNGPIFIDKGKFEWTEDGSSIHLRGKRTLSYKVQEASLIQLMQNGEIVQGDLADTYVLKKQKKSLRSTTWVFTQEETLDEEQAIWLRFNEEESFIYGFSGCNRFQASYSLQADSLLNIGQIISTKMMCSDMEIEDAFLNALGKTSSCQIIDSKLLHFLDDKGHKLMQLK